MSEPIVYQVRSVDAHGSQNVIHAYQTDDEAKNAIAMMRARTGKRYIVVPVENQPNQFWGINVTPVVEPVKIPKKR